MWVDGVMFVAMVALLILLIEGAYSLGKQAGRVAESKRQARALFGQDTERRPATRDDR